MSNPTKQQCCGRCGHTEAAHDLPSINVCSQFLLPTGVAGTEAVQPLKAEDAAAPAASLTSNENTCPHGISRTANPGCEHCALRDAERALAMIAAVTPEDTDVGRYARNYFRRQSKTPELPVETSTKRIGYAERYSGAEIHRGLTIDNHKHLRELQYVLSKDYEEVYRCYEAWMGEAQHRQERIAALERSRSPEETTLLPGEDIAEALERRGDALSVRAARHIRIKWQTEEGLRQQLKSTNDKLNSAIGE